MLSGFRLLYCAILLHYFLLLRTIMANPDRGMWANGRINALAYCADGDIDDTLETSTNQLFLSAHLLLTRTTPNSVQPAITVQQQHNMANYQVWYIFDVRFAEEIRRIFATLTCSVVLVVSLRTMPSGNPVSVTSLPLSPVRLSILASL